jgi:hypothetical protein
MTLLDAKELRGLVIPATNTLVIFTSQLLYSQAEFLL